MGLSLEGNHDSPLSSSPALTNSRESPLSSPHRLSRHTGYLHKANQYRNTEDVTHVTEVLPRLEKCEIRQELSVVLGVVQLAQRGWSACASMVSMMDMVATVNEVMPHRMDIKSTSPSEEPAATVHCTQQIVSLLELMAW